MNSKRVLIAVIVTEMVSLISVGLIVFFIPNILGWTGVLVCPSGTEVEVVQESSGITIPQLFCTGVDGQRSEDRFLPVLLVLYSICFFLVFLVALAWTTGIYGIAGDSVVVPPLNLEGLDMETAVRQLMDRGRKIDAIKLVREQTGMGLKEAKLYVESFISGAGPLPVPSRQAAPTNVQVDVASEARRLLSNGRKIEAIKYVREQTGVGLKEAKEYVESLPAGVSSLGLDPEPVDMESISAEAHRIFAQGNKIEAIKYVREQTGMGLKEAKEYVESL